MKKQCISVLAGVMTAALLAGGCGQAQTAAPESAPAPTATEAPAPTATEVPEEPLKTIGEEKAGEYVYSAILKNETGKNITGFAVKDDSLEEYPESLLKAGDVYAAEEERILYYDAEPVIKAFEERAAAAAESAASAAEEAESVSTENDSEEMQEEFL